MREVLIRASILVLAFAVAMPVFAQQRTGTVDGVVLDEGGVPLPGVTVILTGNNIMGEPATVTDADGQFRFPLVPPGSYTAKAVLPGYQTVHHSEIPVNVGQSAHLTITLESGFEETIEVVAEQVLIDTTSSAVGTNITGDFIGRLANDRQYQMAMEILPGAVEGNNPQMHGASGGDNMYMVDGADSTDPMTRTWSSALNFDNIQDIQIVTGGVSAEYGRGTGALVNLVTKSGSNEFHGTVRMTFADLDWNEDPGADPNNPENSKYFSDATKHVDEKRPAANLGGPILRDKLWFFVSYEKRDKSKFTRRYENWQDAVDDNYTDGSTNYTGEYASAKLTWQPSPSHSIFGNYMIDPIDIPDLYAYIGYNNRTQSADNLREQGGDAFIAEWTGVMSDTVFLTFKYNKKEAPLNNIPNTIDTNYYTWANGGLYFGGSTSEYYTNRNHDIYAGTFTKFIDTASGSHELKAGLEYYDIALDRYSESYPSNTYIRMDGGLDDLDLWYDKYEYTDEGRRGWNNTTQNSVVLYLQDSWRVNANLTLNLGLRVESLQDKANTGEAILDFGWGDRIQPRLGFAYDLNGSNIHGSIGRYHDTIGNYTTRSFADIPDYVRDRYFWDADTYEWDFYRTYVTSPALTSRDDLKSPYMDEITVGYMGRLSQTMAWGVDLIYRTWHDGIEDDDGRDFPEYGNAANDANYHFYNIDKQKEYQGIEFTLRKNLAEDNFQFLASFTYNKTEGVWGDASESTGHADNPYNYYNWYGKRNNYPFMVKFNGSYFAPWGFIFGANFAYYAGPSYNRYGTVVTSADGEWGGDTFSNYYPYEAGSANLPDRWALDLRVEKEFKLSSRLVFGIYFDIFNAFDNQEAVDIDGYIGRLTLVGDEPGAAFTVTSPSSTYLQHDQWQAPRSYFIGVKLDF
jgi:hypothetical protein